MLLERRLPLSIPGGLSRGQMNRDVPQGLWIVEGRASTLGLGCSPGEMPVKKLKKHWVWERRFGSHKGSAPLSLSVQWSWHEVCIHAGATAVRRKQGDARYVPLDTHGYGPRWDERAVSVSWQKMESGFSMSGVESLGILIKECLSAMWYLWHIPRIFSLLFWSWLKLSLTKPFWLLSLNPRLKEYSRIPGLPGLLLLKVSPGNHKCLFPPSFPPWSHVSLPACLFMRPYWSWELKCVRSGFKSYLIYLIPLCINF